MKYKLKFLYGLVILHFCSCTIGSQGELIGSYNRKFDNTKIPLGMVYVPGGRTTIGMTEEDLNFTSAAPPGMTSFKAFFMDETEITNAEYRQFVNWVRDSIAINMLGPAAATEYYYPADKANSGDITRNINWQKVGNGSRLWSTKNGGLGTKLQDMYYAGDDALPGRNEIDVRKIRYAYSIINLDLAAEGRKDPTKKRKDFIEIYTDNPDPAKPNQHPSVSIYPDTMVWKMDYSYSQNDPMVKSYFNHPSYDNYPVVGVSWEQANAFSVWRSLLFRKTAVSRKIPLTAVPEYRLPTEAEFEYAARGGRNLSKFPWGGPYIRNAKGCMQANFKVGRGNYSDDGGLYTVNVRSYFPNDYGLYNMAGNVSEWTATAYNASSRPMLLDFNPNYTYTAKTGDSKYLKRKVVRGGSWKDTGFFLQNGVGTYEYQDESRSYIGFRCVYSYPGADIGYKK
jgi:sulfatase modifying factor 1